MQTIRNDTWLFYIINILFIIILCFVNIFVFVKYKRNIMTAILHASSLFLLFSLLCNMMSRVILQLMTRDLFQQFAALFFWLFLTGLCIDCIVVIYKRVKEKSDFYLPPNLEVAYKSVEDLAVIIDYKGKVINVNHPDREELLPKNVKTLAAILDHLEEHFCIRYPDRDEIMNARDSVCHEIFFRETDNYYSMIISPIFTGGQQVGFLILFLDVTAIKHLEISLSEQNLQLELANKKLTNYIKVAGALEAQTERLHILEDILSLLTVKIERAKENIKKIKINPADSNEYRQGARKIAEDLREIYKEVRAAVSQIAGKVH